MAPAAAARRLETREVLLVAFFAAFLVASRAALRWHLHLPGHAMLPAAFGLVVVRSCVDRRAAASLCGAIAGAAVAALGMGKGGPLIVLKLLLPGAVVDAGASLRRGARPIPIPYGALLGALAGLSAVVPLVIVEALAGAGASVIALHALASGAGKLAFGAVGGAAGAWVARELDHHGLLAAPVDAAAR